MRLPLLWLHDFTSPDVSVKTLEERLTMTGTKVEAVHHHGVGALENFVVGKVLSAEQHPDADRLRVCVVDVGTGEPSGIVCGAPNVAAGQTVAVAKPGSIMPDGTKLKTAKLRGVPSAGMILAEDEVALGTDHDGIMVLDDALQAGAPLAGVLPISTDVLELEITPNRPDCLSVYGVAREVHAALGSPLAPAPWTDDLGSAGPLAGFTVKVDCPDLCPRFTVRAFENVTIGPSPTWLKARLLAAGQRPINNVVDITNFVMLLTGQPLHAFDADRVEGDGLVVRRATDGEQVTTLDDIDRTLDDQMVVIEDASGPTSIAGVMGGNRSEVHDGTTRVLIEAATWNGPNIQRTSTRLGLRSEASGRFEKGLSTGATMEGQIVATRLMLELTGATLVPGTIDVGGDTTEVRVLRLREARVEQVLGRAIDRATQARILEALGFAVAEAEDGLDVRVPHFRLSDVTREIDLVEEVARIDGLEKLPATLPSRRGAVGTLAPEQRLRRRAEDALVGAGLYEVVGWSFTSTAAQARLRTDVEPVRLKNPMSEEQAVMRTHLLGSLLDAAETNARRGASAVRLFEVGSVYLPWSGERPAGRWDPPEGTLGDRAWKNQELPDERTHIGALLTGPVRTASWRDSEVPAADFYAVKGVLEALGRALRVELTFAPTTEPFLHPARAARMLAGDAVAGWVGEVHPGVAEGAAFEVDLAVLAAHADLVPAYRDLTSFPALRFDLAVTLADDIPAASVLETVHKAGGKLLSDASVFDVYRGAQVGEGKVSLALRLAFRVADRTLTDEDVAPARDKIVARLREDLGGELRA
ncbi:MAG: phenylalanyl-tRNA synthetase beta chain [Solirubrobacteraceae bacterium]|nr:phenylalanyl-tRNA synthetase beta chain [Solirubrobacteraceae bacterium]